MQSGNAIEECNRGMQSGNAIRRCNWGMQLGDVIGECNRLIDGCSFAHTQTVHLVVPSGNAIEINSIQQAWLPQSDRGTPLKSNHHICIIHLNPTLPGLIMDRMAASQPTYCDIHTQELVYSTNQTSNKILRIKFWGSKLSIRDYGALH